MKIDDDYYNKMKIIMEKIRIEDLSEDVKTLLDAKEITFNEAQYLMLFPEIEQRKKVHDDLKFIFKEAKKDMESYATMRFLQSVKLKEGIDPLEKFKYYTKFDIDELMKFQNIGKIHSDEKLLKKYEDMSLSFSIWRDWGKYVKDMKNEDIRIKAIELIWGVYIRSKNCLEKLEIITKIGRKENLPIDIEEKEKTMKRKEESNMLYNFEHDINKTYRSYSRGHDLFDDQLINNFSEDDRKKVIEIIIKVNKKFENYLRFLGEIKDIEI